MKSPFAKNRKPLLSDEQQAKVVAAIRASEQRTSGEIRVFVESKCKYVDAMDRAHEVFKTLQMDETENKNAVLLYIALHDHQFAIYGDEQIYIKAGGQSFWDSAAAQLRDYLMQDQMTEGVCLCVKEIGEVLSVHYPYDPSVDKNELPDEIVLGV